MFQINPQDRKEYASFPILLGHGARKVETTGLWPSIYVRILRLGATRHDAAAEDVFEVFSETGFS